MEIGNNVWLQHFPIGVVLYSGIPETAQTMLKTKASKKKLLKIISPPSVKPPETAPDTPSTPFDSPPVEPKQEPPTPFKRKPGRPEKKSFWDHVNEIPLSEWQAKRFYLYAYLSEPFCNIKTEGEPGYLRKFYEPVDPEFFLKEWGSGKYFLRLKEKRPGEKSDRDVDTLTFEIYNPTYPPKLPRKLWENDPRNERWLSMLPKEQKEASKQETMEILNAMFDMQDRIEDRMERAKGAEESQSPNAILDTAARLIELTKPKENGTPAAAAIDPWAAAERILNMRSDNPMVTILQGELTALRHSLDEERKERIELQTKMWEAKLAALEAKMAPTASPAKSLVEQIKELTTIKSEVANLLGFGTDGAAAPRSRMSGTMEFWKDLVTEVINAPVLNGVGQMLLSRFMQGAPGMAVSGANPAQNGVAQSPAVNLIQWVQGTLMEPIVRFLNGNSDGGDFADYVFEGWPDRLVPLQRMTHPQMPGQTGAPVIIELFRHSDIWQTQLAYRETQFRQFVTEFCAWRPEGEPEPAPQTAANPHVPQDRSGATPIDLDSEEAGKGEEIRP